MTRPLRIQYSNAWYHVMSRGRSRTKIFHTPEDLLKTRRGQYNEARNIAMYLIRKHTGTELKDIGQHFGMSNYSSVGSVITRTKQEMVRNRNLRQRVEKVEKLFA